MDSKCNVIKWYPFKENAEVLEIFNQESVLEKCGLNIQLVTKQMNNIDVDSKFDYIVCIDVFEYAPIICAGINPYDDFLAKLKKWLKPNGVVLFTVENRIGIKYLTGGKSKLYNKVFEGIESNELNSKPNALLKGELDDYIEKSGFKNHKYYYPLGDSENTNTIFTDEFLPKSNHSKIMYPVNYNKGSYVIFNEINVIKQICDNNDFANFANSYLVELSDGECSKVRFVNYNVFRKDKYQLMLIIDDTSVRKYAETEEAKEHINNIKNYISDLQSLGARIKEDVEDGVITSNFCNFKELDKILINYFEAGENDTLIKCIKKYYDYIKNLLCVEKIDGPDIFTKYSIDVSDELKAKLCFVKKGYIDLIFENIFVENDEYIFYDQEWYYENIPVEFILYRAINNLYIYNEQKMQECLEKEYLLKEFGLLEFVDCFKQIEEKIQSDIIEAGKVEEYRVHNKSVFYDIETNCDRVRIAEDRAKEYENRYRELEVEHGKLVEIYTVLQNEYNYSRAWKLIKKIRKILGRG